MKRRGFLGMLGLGAAVASPNVKQSEPLPATPAAVETFAGGYLKHLKQPAAVDYWGGNRACWFDVRDGILYDRVRFEAGQSLPSHLRLFQAPLGQPCPYTHRVKTLLDTNMHNAGQLCAPNEFLARDVIFAAHPSVSQSDLEILSAGAYWELWLLQKRTAYAFTGRPGPRSPGRLRGPRCSRRAVNLLASMTPQTISPPSIKTWVYTRTAPLGGTWVQKTLLCSAGCGRRMGTFSNLQHWRHCCQRCSETGGAEHAAGCDEHHVYLSALTVERPTVGDTLMVDRYLPELPRGVNGWHCYCGTVIRADGPIYRVRVDFFDGKETPVKEIAAVETDEQMWMGALRFSYEVK